MNSIDPDLGAVRAAGKKIIQYHGWADVLIPAQYSIAYYKAVEQYLGSDIRDYYRLFMVPGMNHCGGGPGPNIFGNAYRPSVSADPEHNALSALVQWVENGRVPRRIVATKYKDDDPEKPAMGPTGTLDDLRRLIRQRRLIQRPRATLRAGPKTKTALRSRHEAI